MRYPPLPELEALVRRRVSPVGGVRKAPLGLGAGRSATKKRRAELHHRALAIIEQRYSDANLTLKVLAREMSVPERTLQLTFTEAGRSFRDQLHAVRMRRATELVLQIAKPASIAPKVGYRHPNHFARAFEATHGVSPSVLRRALISRRRYEVRRRESPPESPRSLRALERRMAKDGHCVRLVHRQLAGHGVSC